MTLSGSPMRRRGRPPFEKSRLAGRRPADRLTRVPAGELVVIPATNDEITGGHKFVFSTGQRRDATVMYSGERRVKKIDSTEI